MLLHLFCSLIFPFTVVANGLLEQNKRRLLDGLSLSRRPRSIRDPPRYIPDNVGGVEEVVIEPDDYGTSCQTSSGTVPNCFKFSIEPNGELVAAYLIISTHSKIRQKRLSLKIYEVNEYFGDEVLIDHVHLERIEQDELQIKFDMIRDLHRLARFRTVVKLIRIEATIDSSPPVDVLQVLHRPPSLLVAVSRTVPSPISADCNDDDDSPCCLHRFYVNFTEIGWSDWILYPEGFYANYCSGQCEEDGLRARLDQEREEQHIVNEAFSHHELVFLSPPKCIPERYGAIQIVYAVSENEIRRTTLHGMTVESCRCAV